MVGVVGVVGMVVGTVVCVDIGTEIGVVGVVEGVV